MRITDIVNNARRRFSEVSTLLRHPGQVLSQKLRRSLQRSYEKAEIPGLKNPKLKNVPQKENRQPETVEEPLRKEDFQETVVKQVQQQNLRLQEREPHSTFASFGKDRQPLEKDKEIAGGRRGRYRIISLHQDQKNKRQYNAIQVVNNKAVFVQEHLLSDEFNQEEITNCKHEFEHLANLNLKTGEGQNFRIISPWDVIVPVDPEEKSCYLIWDKEEFKNIPTLQEKVKNREENREIVEDKGYFKVDQVIRILEQVLQTLWFLHNQRFRLASGDLKKGLAHANLTLETLHIDLQEEQTVINGQDFFIYVSDLALWKNPADNFDKDKQNPSLIDKNIKQDLVDLGYISLYLISGQDLGYKLGEKVDPKVDQKWSFLYKYQEDEDKNEIKEFLRRLIGLDKNNQLETAEIALRELRQLKDRQWESNLEVEAEEEKKDNSHKIRLAIYIFILILIISFLGVLIKRLFGRQIETTVENLGKEKTECCFESILKAKNIPSGQFTYITENGGDWDYLLKASGRVAIDYGDQNTLYDELNRRINSSLKDDPTKVDKTSNDLRENLQFILDSSENVNSSLEIIEKLKNNPQEINFALTREIDDLPDGFKQEIVAYHGLVILVPFSDDKTGKQNIFEILAQKLPWFENSDPKSNPEVLNGGINLATLRELYSRDLDPQELEGFQGKDELKDFNIKLYLPYEAGAIQLFSDLILDTGQPLNPNLTRKIHERQKLQLNEFLEKRGENYQLTTLDTLGKIAETPTPDGDNIPLNIGFAFLSTILGQCSVYPLAVGNENQEVQPIFQTNGQPIDPTTDLCNDKRSYWPNPEVFKSKRYPLSYPLVVVYSENNLAGEQFAALLKTDEGQHLLREAGLVPLQSLE